jgi:hypothetical protein
MAAKFADLVSYFEKIAAEHIEIKHTKAKCRFYRFELDEVITASCVNINYPALILEAYDFNYKDSRADNIMKSRSGAFILIDKVKDSGNYNEIHQVWDKLEAIGDDILVRMRSDKASRLVPVLRDFDISESEGVPFPVQDLGQYGVRFTFSLKSPVNVDIDNSRWLTNP